jgi:hypothetical protein
VGIANWSTAHSTRGTAKAARSTEAMLAELLAAQHQANLLLAALVRNLCPRDPAARDLSERVLGLRPPAR